jgi:hypothetical protein
MPWLRFLRGSHGATVASLADPQNGRSPRHITLPCSDLAFPLQLERNRSQQAMIAWQQRAGPAEHSQGRKSAEPVARSASLDGAPLVRQRSPMRSWPHFLPSMRNKTLRCERWRSERLFRMLSRFERHQAASCGAATVPSKTMCRQTLTTPDGTERHRRFYLAVNPRPQRPQDPHSAELESYASPQTQGSWPDGRLIMRDKFST